MIKKYGSKKSAFTLSEVLLTLVIIGVVAAITVPSVVNATERRGMVSGLKKVHSVLNLALKQILHNNGLNPSDIAAFYDDLNFMNEFIKISNVVKTCYTFTSCFDADTNKKHVRLDNQPLNASSGKSIITANNVMYGYKHNPSVANIYGLSPEDTAKTIDRIIVDVNGTRGPNKLGYDTFIFYLVENKGFVPAGSYSNTYCQSNNQAGLDCAGRVLKEGVIKY